MLVQVGSTVKMKLVFCIFAFISVVESRSKRQTVVTVSGVVPAGSSVQVSTRNVVGVNCGGWTGLRVVRPITQKVACNCWDIRSGSHPHGSVWNNREWKLRCNNGTLEVLACIAQNGQEIGVNSTVTIDGFWHKCVDQGPQVRYSREPSCFLNGKRIHINDTFPTNTFKMKCEEWGYSIVGCIYLDSKNKKQELSVGQSFDDGRWRHSCMPVPEVDGRVKYEKTALVCEYDGKIYRKGESWIAKNMNHVCNDFGSYRITNCVTDSGKAIPIGQTLMENNLVHKCYRAFNGVYYESFGCGWRGVPCQGGVIPSVPQTGNFGGGTFVIPQGSGSGGSRVFHKNNNLQPRPPSQPSGYSVSGRWN